MEHKTRQYPAKDTPHGGTKPSIGVAQLRETPLLFATRAALPLPAKPPSEVDTPVNFFKAMRWYGFQGYWYHTQYRYPQGA
jgi:hypothetical protein